MKVAWLIMEAKVLNYSRAILKTTVLEINKLIYTFKV